VLWTGRYFPKDALRRLWLQITGDSYIIDVRLVRSREDLVTYLTEYLTKTIAKRVLSDPDRLTEAVLALHGRKLLVTFGNWCHLSLLATPDDDAEWTAVCSIDALLQAVIDGHPAALQVASTLWRHRVHSWLKEHPP